MILRMRKPLQKELETFEKLKLTLLGEEGKYAVIAGEELLGIYTSYEDASKEGYRKCGLNPFLVRKIAMIEPINFFTRDFLAPCLT